MIEYKVRGWCGRRLVYYRDNVKPEELDDVVMEAKLEFPGAKIVVTRV